MKTGAGAVTGRDTNIKSTARACDGRWLKGFRTFPATWWGPADYGGADGGGGTLDVCGRCLGSCSAQLWAELVPVCPCAPLGFHPGGGWSSPSASVSVAAGCDSRAAARKAGGTQQGSGNKRQHRDYTCRQESHSCITLVHWWWTSMVPSMTCPEAFIPDWSANTTVCPGKKTEGVKTGLHIYTWTQWQRSQNDEIPTLSTETGL